MNRIFIAVVSVLVCLWFSGCASENINQGANRTGQAVGGAARIPNSFMEGAASGTAGQPSRIRIIDSYSDSLCNIRDKAFGKPIQSMRPTLPISNGCISCSIIVWLLLMGSAWLTPAFATLTVKNARQYRADTGAAIPDPSGTIPAGVGVYFDCAPTDTTGATIQMQVELQKLPANWTGNPNHVSSFVASGSRPRTPSAAGLAAGNYGWRYRVVNSAGVAGNWVAANNPDFIVQAAAALPSTSPASHPVIAQPIYTPATVPATVAVTPPPTVSVNPPTINLPGSASPPGTVVNSLTPNFNWNNANGATGYGLYIRNMTAPGTPLVYPNASGITARPVASIDFGSGPTFTLPAGILVNGHTYRWNVTSFSGATEGSRVSSVLYFQTPSATVAVTPPPAVSVNPPKINLPGSASPPGTMVNSLTPNFNWNNANGATGYGLYIRDMTAPGAPLVYPNASGITDRPVASIDFGSGPTFTLPPGILVNGHTYRWNVTSFNGTTEGNKVSSVLYFQT